MRKNAIKCKLRTMHRLKKIYLFQENTCQISRILFQFLIIYFIMSIYSVSLFNDERKAFFLERVCLFCSLYSSRHEEA